MNVAVLVWLGVPSVGTPKRVPSIETITCLPNKRLYPSFLNAGELMALPTSGGLWNALACLGI